MYSLNTLIINAYKWRNRWIPICWELYIYFLAGFTFSSVKQRWNWQRGNSYAELCCFQETMATLDLCHSWDTVVWLSLVHICFIIVPWRQDEHDKNIALNDFKIGNIQNGFMLMWNKEGNYSYYFLLKMMPSFDTILKLTGLLWCSSMCDYK